VRSVFGEHLVEAPLSEDQYAVGDDIDPDEGADERVRIGVVGAGIMGADHVKTLHRFVPGATAAAVADIALDRAADLSLPRLAPLGGVGGFGCRRDGRPAGRRAGRGERARRVVAQSQAPSLGDVDEVVDRAV
jgi:hypothetical protein